MSQHMIMRRIRLLLVIFMISLILSGVTAFFPVWGSHLLDRFFGMDSTMNDIWPAMAQWISTVARGMVHTDEITPYLFYGTDWLAFAHIVIAIAFIGPWRDPVKNIWVIEFGIIACLLVIPTAMIFGPIRGIPFFWRCLDCMFGILGLAILIPARHYSNILRDVGKAVA